MSNKVYELAGDTNWAYRCEEHMSLPLCFPVKNCREVKRKCEVYSIEQQFKTASRGA